MYPIKGYILKNDPNAKVYISSVSVITNPSQTTVIISTSFLTTGNI